MAAKLAGSGGGKFDLGQNSDINVTPFVDIMLVLLIIFMVAAPLATVSIKVDIPPAIPNPNEIKKDPVFINVEQDHKVYIGAKETSLDTLIYDITAALSVDSANPREACASASSESSSSALRLNSSASLRLTSLACQ